MLVRQSFFHNDPSNCEQVGGNILGCRGFHSSFRTTQGGMSLNMGTFHLYLTLVLDSVFCSNDLVSNSLCLVLMPDVTTTMIIKPGPVVDFLIANQNARDPYSIDWSKVNYLL